MLIRMSRQQIAQRARRHVDSTPGMRMTMLQCSQLHCWPTTLSCTGPVLPYLHIVWLSLREPTSRRSSEYSAWDYVYRTVSWRTCQSLSTPFKVNTQCKAPMIDAKSLAQEIRQHFRPRSLQVPFAKSSVKDPAQNLLDRFQSCCSRSLCKASFTRCL